MMRLRLLLLLVVLPGLVGMIVFGGYAWQDWLALQKAYAEFEQAVRETGDLSSLFVAEAKQNMHRINLFAEGVWALLCGVIVAIGLHGLCTGAKADK